jgi:hypothetical protein
MTQSPLSPEASALVRALWRGEDEHTLVLGIVMQIVLPYLEWMERGDDPKHMDANMAEELPHVIRLARSLTTCQEPRT